MLLNGFSTQDVLVGNATRQWLLIAVRHVVLYCLKEAWVNL